MMQGVNGQQNDSHMGRKRGCNRSQTLHGEANEEAKMAGQKGLELKAGRNPPPALLMQQQKLRAQTPMGKSNLDEPNPASFAQKVIAQENNKKDNLIKNQEEEAAK